LKTVRLVAIH